MASKAAWWLPRPSTDDFPTSSQVLATATRRCDVRVRTATPRSPVDDPTPVSPLAAEAAAKAARSPSPKAPPDTSDASTEKSARAAAFSLNKQLQRAESARAVVSLALDQYDNLTAINWATALQTAARRARDLSSRQRRAMVASPAFRAVVEGAALSAPGINGREGMGERELSNSLWALGAVGYPADAWGAALLEECVDRVDAFSARDLSTCLWAAGRMGRHPGPLLDLAAGRLAELLGEEDGNVGDRDDASTARPTAQDLAMALSALARLGHDPGPLLDRVCALAASEEPGPAGSPAVLSALARCVARANADQPALWTLCEEKMIANALPLREAANVLGAMALAGWQPAAATVRTIVALLATTGPAADAMDAAQIVHAAVSLRGGADGDDGGSAGCRGLGLGAIVSAHAGAMRPRELGLCLWSLALAPGGARDHAAALQGLVALLEAADAEERLDNPVLRQMAQAELWAEAEGTPLEVAPGLRGRAAGAWIGALGTAPPGRISAEVAAACEALGLDHRLHARLMDGRVAVGVAARAAAAEQEPGSENGEGKGRRPSSGSSRPKVALEVLGRRSVAANTGALLGADAAKAELLEGLGWPVAHVSADEWGGLTRRGRTRLVAARCEAAGVPVAAVTLEAALTAADAADAAAAALAIEIERGEEEWGVDSDLSELGGLEKLDIVTDD